jgi:hypothetical protein
LRCVGSSTGSSSKTISDDEPVTSMASCASSRIVNSLSFPMFIGPVWSLSRRAMKPRISSST